MEGKLVVNARILQFEGAMGLQETLFVLGLLYGIEKVVWREKLVYD